MCHRTLLLLFALGDAAIAGEQQFAELGTCELQSGEAVEDCRIGYRTYGGMQVFEWTVRYPRFSQKMISITGTPWQTSYDLLQWKTQLHVIETLADVDYESALRVVAGLDNLHLTTAARTARETGSSEYEAMLSKSIGDVRAYGLADRVPQLEAMIGHDITDGFDGSAEAAANAIAADLLIIVDTGDLMVTPGPSRQLAQVADADFHELSSGCGHLVTACDQDEIVAIVQRFLQNDC